jgi:translation initiation factor IF-2
MAQKRVYELARELKISPQALISILRDLKVKVSGHMSYVDDDAIEQVKKIFSEQRLASQQRQKERREYQEKVRRKQIQEQKHARKTSSEGKAEPKYKTKFKVKPAPKTVPEKKSAKIVSEPKHKPFKPKKEYPRKEKELKPQAPQPVAEKEKKPTKERYRDRRAKLQEEREKKFFDQQQIKENIKATLSKDIKERKSKKEKPEQQEEPKKLVVSEFTSVDELAKLVDRSPAKIIAKFMELGKMVTINQRLDKDSLIMICDEFNFEVEFADQYGSDILSKIIEEEKVEEKPRPPIVAILGHVDHGKTSILDYIRKTNVIAGEAGGITQHIGAYQVLYNGKKITFIDTPGHEAFTAMRARGADITDIVILVVAADDGVMPQTIEAIDHAKAAGKSIIVAINKIDLPNANPSKVKAQLSEHNVRLQGWGGDIEYVECSAKTGQGIPDLLETILLVAELEELKARYSGKAEGVELEAKLDKGRGPVATVLLKNGILKQGDIVVCGAYYGRIRQMLDERQNPVATCEPSGVVQILGLNGVPQAGDTLNAVDNEKLAKEISSKRQHIIRERQLYTAKEVSLDNLYEKIQQKQINALNMIVKADTDGSGEAMCDALERLSTSEVTVNIIHRGVGGIVEADVDLAAASDAIILGFQVRPNAEARKAAERQKVEIRLYNIIFEAIEDAKKALEGMLKPIIHEELISTARVKEIFKIAKVGTVAGCVIEEGKIHKDALVKVYHENIKVYEGKIASLKHFQKDVKEVIAGQECGISIENFNDIKQGDIIEAYTIVEERRKLEDIK